MFAEKSKLHQREKAHKPGSLRTIALDVTARCNMRCPHCYAETFVKATPIELNILEKALKEAYELGVYHYVLQGGEAIEDPERLETIISMIRPEETYITVVTNGWNMSSSKIQWLKELQVDKICVSLDSGVEKEHDTNRRPGSYAKVLETVDNVLQAGLIASVSTVVTRNSVESEGFQKVYLYAKEKGIRVDVQIAMPVGKWDGHKEVLVSRDDVGYLKHLQLTSPPLPSGQPMIKRDIYGGKEDYCPAGKEFLGITADGNLLPCNFLQFTLGNIRDITIKGMREALLTSTWFNQHPVCLCGEDSNFIDNYIVPYVGQPKPLDAMKIFNLRGVSHEAIV